MIITILSTDDDGDRCLYTSERDCGNRFEWELSPVADQHGVFTIRNPHTNNYLKVMINEVIEKESKVFRDVKRGQSEYLVYFELSTGISYSKFAIIWFLRKLNKAQKLLSGLDFR